jgi:hypothetical protein
VFLDWIGGEKAMFEELDDEKILLPVVRGTQPCHGTTGWYGGERDVVRWNQNESDD